MTIWKYIKKFLKMNNKIKIFFDQKNKMTFLWKILEYFFVLFTSYIKTIVGLTKIKKNNVTIH